MNKKMLIEFFKVCVDVQCETLFLSIGFDSNTKSVSVHYVMGGYKVFSLTQLVCVETDFNKASQAVIGLKAEHDKLYAPENIKETQEKARLAEIARLQKLIEALS